MKLSGILTACLFATAVLPSAAEPLELTRLRTQFEHRVEQQSAPLKKTYLAELAKLEQRLASGNRLEDALLVKQEREALGGGAKAPSIASVVQIKSVDALTKALGNSTWEYVTGLPSGPSVSYIILLKGGVVHFAWNNTQGTWKATDRNKVEFEIPGTAGRQTVTMKFSADFQKWEGTHSADQHPRSGSRITPPSSP